MSSWAESKSVTSQCWKLVRENRYFLAFPVIAFAIGLVFIFVLGVPAVLLLAVDNQQGPTFIAGLVLLAVMAYLIALGTQFSMAGLVAAADEELHGRKSSVGGGLGRASKRIGAIAAWAGMAAVFRVAMAFIEDKAGTAGDVVSAIGGVAWRLVTFFVLPYIVLEEVGAITGIKDSARLLKKRWGMKIYGGVRIGGVIMLFAILPTVIVAVIGIFALIGGVPAVGIPVAILAFIVLLGAGLLMATLRVVFAVALYRYASEDQTLGGFATEQLEAAVTLKR
ncbi:MAG: hypothetical protein HQ526_03810 [Actinobacteria bacterium]|nr:hypothetical protein [Actinomycetota bacterium]